MAKKTVKKMGAKSASGDVARLLGLGFRLCGEWRRKDNKRPTADFLNEEFSASENVLYAFVCEGIALYIGQTTTSMYRRMYSVSYPGTNSYSTNYKNRKKILDLIDEYKKVEIYMLPDNGLLRYGGIHVNLAIALEKGLTDEINPPWSATSPTAKKKKKAAK